MEKFENYEYAVDPRVHELADLMMCFSEDEFDSVASPFGDSDATEGEFPEVTSLEKTGVAFELVTKEIDTFRLNPSPTAMTNELTEDLTEDEHELLKCITESPSSRLRQLIREQFKRNRQEIVVTDDEEESSEEGGEPGDDEEESGDDEEEESIEEVEEPTIEEVEEPSSREGGEPSGDNEEEESSGEESSDNEVEKRNDEKRKKRRQTQKSLKNMFRNAKVSAQKSLNYYDLLGVDQSASATEIKKAYFKKAKETHPDLNKDDPNAKEKFQKINDIYCVLKDKFKRAKYDETLRSSTTNKKRKRTRAVNETDVNWKRKVNVTVRWKEINQWKCSFCAHELIGKPKRYNIGRHMSLHHGCTILDRKGKPIDYRKILANTAKKKRCKM